MMKPRWSIGYFIVIATLAIASGAGLASQWRKTMSLRNEPDLVRMAASDLERLQAENQRLRAQQIPVAELETLRADHAALPRLRLELGTPKKSAPAPVR
jgi:hypothetical protein